MTDHIRIATYNVRDLFAPGHPGGGKRPRELRELARMVSKLGADLLGIQEVENRAALGALNERIRAPYAYLESTPGNSARGINLGFMSRFPLAVCGHADTLLVDDAGRVLRAHANEEDAEAGVTSPLLIRRDLALARIVIGRTTIAVFNAHLKSRIENAWSGIDSDVVRTAEAAAVAGIVSRYEAGHPEHLVVLLGDFNHRHDHASLEPIMALGYFDPVLEELVPSDVGLTTRWGTPRDRIDYLLLSRAARAHYVPGSATLHREAGARKASDHYPLSIALSG